MEKIKNLPLVTICIPVYGVEMHIEKCATSLFGQSYNNIEYVIVDDCSPDRSIELLKSLSLRYPNLKERIRIVRHDVNRGLAAARNTAVKYANGDFILHVDSDDWVDNTIVEGMVRKQSEDDYDLVFCEFKNHFLDFNQDVPCGDYYSSREMTLAMIRGGMRHCVCGVLIRTSLYRTYDISAYEGHNMDEDRQVMPRLCYYAKKVAVVHKPMYHYNNMNANAYTASWTSIFSPKNRADMVFAHNLLYEFFKDKGDDFLDAVEYSNVSFVASTFYGLAQIKGFDELYIENKNKLKTLDSNYVRQLPVKLRFTMYLSFSRCLLSMYVKTGMFVKRLKNRG